MWKLLFLHIFFDVLITERTEKMKRFLKDYISEYEKELNTDLMDKTYDAPLVDYIIDCWK